MTSQQTFELEDFLDQFFGEGNDLTKEQIVGGKTALGRCVQEWLNHYKMERRWILLPRQCGKELDWYAIAFTGSAFRDLREQLMAFIGPSYSTFQGERALLNEEDTVEKNIIDFLGTNPMVFRFKSAKDDWKRQQLIEALDLMHLVSTDADTRPPELQMATGRVLRDFHIAMAVGNRNDAEDAIQYLRKHHRLDALNLQFLEVQLLSELGLWEEILALPNIHEILRSRHPRSVSGALIKAIYQHYLSHYEENHDVDGACQTFQNEVRPQFDALFYSRKGLIGPDVLKSFMLVAVTETPQHPGLRDDILSIPGIPPSDISYLEVLGKLIPDKKAKAVEKKEVIQDVLTKAREALEQRLYDDAVELTSYVDQSLDRARILLECAYELQTISLEKLALDAVKVLTEKDRNTLFQSRKNQDFWETITKPDKEITVKTQIDTFVPSNWLEWFSMLPESSYSRERILLLAEMGVDEWSIDEFVHLPGVVEKCIETMEKVTQHTLGRERFHETLPHFLRFLEMDLAFPRAILKPVYNTLRMEFVYSCETGTTSDFVIFSDLCEVSLELGVDSVEYQAILDEATHLWTDFASFSNLRPILDILDRFMYFPCPSNKEEDRLAFATTVFTKLIPWIQSGRIDSETRRFIRQLSGELQLTPLFDGIESIEKDLSIDRGEKDPLAALTGTIAIHTLVESAGTRIKEILKHRSPHCKVAINHDKVGTTRLRELSRNVDIFVMATHSSKHAATTSIENYRKNQPILKPIGKGTSSILYALVKYMGQVK